MGRLFHTLRGDDKCGNGGMQLERARVVLGANAPTICIFFERTDASHLGMMSLSARYFTMVSAAASGRVVVVSMRSSGFSGNS